MTKKIDPLDALLVLAASDGTLTPTPVEDPSVYKNGSFRLTPVGKGDDLFFIEKWDGYAGWEGVCYCGIKLDEAKRYIDYLEEQDQQRQAGNAS